MAGSNRRLISLDVLRFAAVVGVLGAHLVSGQTEDAIAHTWARIGWTGVDLFFVLSGYLVSGLLFSEYTRSGDIRPGRFLFRRGMKIYPAFYVYLATVIVVLLLRGETVWRRAAFYEAIFVQNYGPNVWMGHTWSLAVEEHFYILLVAALLAMLRLSGSFRAVPTLVVSVASLCLLLRVATIAWHPIFDGKIHHCPTHLRIDSLAFGVLLRYWHHFHPDAFVQFALRWRWVLIGFCAACLSLIAFVPDTASLEVVHFKIEKWMFVSSVGLSLLYMGYGALLVAVMGGGFPENRLTNVLAKIGTYSYSIYLWHMVVLLWVMPLIAEALPVQLSFWQFAAIYVPLALAFGSLMSKLVEWPVLQLRDRLMPDVARQRRSPVADEPRVQAIPEIGAP